MCKICKAGIKYVILSKDFMIKNGIFIIFINFSCFFINFGMDTILFSNTNEYCLEKILVRYIEKDEKNMIYLILKKGYEIDKVHKSCPENNGFGDTMLTGKILLHLAVQSEKYDIMKMLLELGANPNIKDRYGNTSIFYAMNLIFNKHQSFSGSESDQMYNKRCSFYKKKE